MAVDRDPATLTALAGALSPLAQAVTTKEGGTTQTPGRSQPANTTVGPGSSAVGSSGSGGVR